MSTHHFFREGGFFPISKKSFLRFFSTNILWHIYIIFYITLFIIFYNILCYHHYYYNYYDIIYGISYTYLQHIYRQNHIHTKSCGRKLVDSFFQIFHFYLILIFLNPQNLVDENLWIRFSRIYKSI